MELNRFDYEIVQLALYRSRALKEELSKLRENQYPPSGAQRLIRLARSANEWISRDISSLLPNAAEGFSLSEAQQSDLRIKVKLLGHLHELMRFLDGAKIEDCPVPFVASLRYVLAEHLGTFDFIVRSARLFNYGTIELSKSLKEFFEGTGYEEILGDFPKPFFVVECPISERRNTLAHCIFGHEIAHQLYDARKLGATLTPLVIRTVQRKLDARIQSATMGQERQKAIQLSFNKLVDLTDIASKWAKELCADAIAACLFAPSYLFAFVGFAIPFLMLDFTSDSHPSDRMRIRFICEFLLQENTGLGYRTVGEIEAYLEELVKYSAKQMTKNGASLLHSIASEVVEEISPNIMTEAKHATEQRRYEAQRFQKEVPPLCDDCLAIGIPPNEITVDWESGDKRTSDPISILNAGWMFLLTRRDEYAKLLGSTNGWHVRNRLLALIEAGLEYSELQRRTGVKKIGDQGTSGNHRCDEAS